MRFVGGGLLNPTPKKPPYWGGAFPPAVTTAVTTHCILRPLDILSVHSATFRNNLIPIILGEMFKPSLIIQIVVQKGIFGNRKCYWALSVLSHFANLLRFSNCRPSMPSWCCQSRAGRGKYLKAWLLISSCFSHTYKLIIPLLLSLENLATGCSKKRY